MPERTDTVIAPPSTSSAWKAQDPRRGAPDEAAMAAEYAAVASQAQATAAMVAQNATGTSGRSLSKAATQNLPGAVRDRGTSSRAFSDRTSAMAAFGGGASDPTSRASELMKSSTSRHDPAARLGGTAPTDASAPGSESPSQIRDNPREGANASRGAGASATKAASAAPPAATSLAQGAPPPNAAAALQAASGAVQPKPAPAGDGNSANTSSASGHKATASTRAVITGAVQTNNRGAQNQDAATTHGSSGGKSEISSTSGVRAFEITMRKARGKANAPAPQAPEKAVPAQALRGLAAVLRQKGGNVTLRLAPDSLGDLKISMKLDGPQVWATIEATSESARQLLEDKRDTLREALEAHGLKVERLEVSAVKPEAGSEDKRTGVKDHTPTQDSARPDSSATTGEDRRHAENWSGTLQGSVPGGSAGGSSEDAGGAGEMLLTVRGAPVNLWTEPQGKSMRLRVDAVA